MKKLLLLVMAVVVVGCGKKEDGKPQSKAKTPSSTASTKSEPQTEPTDTDTDTDTEKEKPLSEGTKLLIAQAEKGDADAAKKLGDMYYLGMNAPEDGKESVKWYRKSANGGNDMAQVILAGFYYTGDIVYDIVKQDPVTAWAWANIAFENGNLGAEFVKDGIPKGLAPGTTPMTAEQIAKAKALSKEIIKKNPKLIKKEE